MGQKKFKEYTSMAALTSGAIKKIEKKKKTQILVFKYRTWNEKQPDKT